MSVAVAVSPQPGTGRSRPVLELLLVVGLVELDLWYVAAVRGFLHLAVFLGVVTVVGLSFYRRWSAQRPARRPLRGWCETLAATVVLGAVLILSAWGMRENYETWHWLLPDGQVDVTTWLVRRFTEVMLQQLVLQFFLYPLCLEIFGRKGVALAASALIFGLIHLPSPLLALLTGLAATAWITLYQRNGLLVPLIVSHVFMGTLAHRVLPDRLSYGMGVGIRAVAKYEEQAIFYAPEVRAQLRIYAAPEYYTRHGGTDAGFIQSLYLDLFQRPASPREVQLWVEHMQELTHLEVAELFVTAAEHRELRYCTAIRTPTHRVGVP